MAGKFTFGFVLFLLQAVALHAYEVRGRVIDRGSREPLAYVLVKVMDGTAGSVSDESGYFVIPNLKGGTYRLEASFVGYQKTITPEFMLGGRESYVEIELPPTSVALNDLTIIAGPYRKPVESPVALRVIGFTEIERSAGANRDISRVLQSFPGVASSPSGYRNDLVVRGGGPSENRYYLDGVEVPNINHFATQGASGGPVGIINADLIREVDFYSGAFPVNRFNAMSSVLDFKLKEGSQTGYNFSAVLGSSEVGVTADGHIGDKFTYLVSARQSYLQFLFKALKLPFLPTFTDLQFKMKYRIDRKNDITLLGLVGFDDMVLNTDTIGLTDGNKYLLASLPVIKQYTNTFGAVYKHYEGDHTQTVVLSRNRLRNDNFKHLRNDESERKVLDLHSTEAEVKFRAENVSQLGLFRLAFGVSADYLDYTNDTKGEAFAGGVFRPYTYQTDLSFFKYGLFVSSQFETEDGRLTSSIGLRADGASFNESMSNPLNQLSPRASIAYEVVRKWYLNGSAGLYYQLPSAVSLGYKNLSGSYANKDLKYQRATHVTLGIEHRPTSYARLTIEGFYKHYGQALISLVDSIPLASKGADYGVVGAEPLASIGEGRAYGVEVLARWFGHENLNFLVAYTFVRSEYAKGFDGDNRYLPSSWDNRHLLTLTSNYNLPMNWNIGLKYRLVGPAPYTPVDLERSSLKSVWDGTGRVVLDYSRYNSLRTDWFNQLDLRIDKVFFFNKQMLLVYLDLQNVLNTKYDDTPVYVSTGVEDPNDPLRYQMKRVERRIGTIVPAIGVQYKF